MGGGGGETGSVILVRADWKDHLRWRVSNYDLARRKMLRGNFVLWIQVSATAAHPSAAAAATFGITHQQERMV